MRPADGWGERLYLFVKPPRIGRAKTRLAREIGAGAAATFYRNSVSALTERLGADPRFETRLAVDGAAETAAGWPGLWPEEMVRTPQGKGDLGDRLRRLLRTAPTGPVVVLGSDAPQIAAGHVARAFDALRAHNLVLGPAGDGGYWLVGVRRMKGAGGLFRSVRWSTEHALADTVASAPSGIRVAYLEMLEDVDDAASFRRASRLRSRPAPSRRI